MLGGGQNGGASWERFWNELPYGFKHIIILTLAIGVISIISNIFIFLFGNLYALTVSKLQLWRLFTSFLVDASIINVIFSLYLMNSSVPQIEKRYSTVYIFIEIFIQSALCNIGFALIEFIMATLSLVNPQFSYCLGLTPLMFIFLWKRVAQNPNESTKFCFFPCLMPQKYLPWSFLALTLMFGVGISSVIACCLGYYQSMVLKRSLITIPLSFYRKFQRCLPKSIKDNSNFIQTSDVQNALRTVCYSQSEPSSSPINQRNPYDREEAHNDGAVAVSGGGVSIGSSSRSSPNNANIPDFRRAWLQDEIEQRIPAAPTFVTDQPSQEPFKIQSQHNQTMISDYPLVDTEEEIDERRTEQKK